MEMFTGTSLNTIYMEVSYTDRRARAPDASRHITKSCGEVLENM